MKNNKKKFQNFVKENYKVVKYKITGNFGLCEIGDIVDGYLITESVGQGLIYFPYGKSGCGCFEICKCDQKREIWVSQKKNTWINFE